MEDLEWQRLLEQLKQEQLALKEQIERTTSSEVNYQPVEYILSENETLIAEALNSQLPQLAPFVVFELACRLGRVSNLLIAPRASGKTKTAIITSKILPAERLDNITLQTLKEKLNGRSKVDLFLEDMTNLVQTQVLPVVATLIFQHQYDSGELKIPPVDFCFFAGCQHEKVEQLINLLEWTQMLQDRMLRVYLFYLSRPSVNSPLKEDEFPEIPNIQIPERSPNTVSFEIDEKTLLNLASILESQISPDRTVNYAKNILAGHATLSGRDTVTEEDADWLKLYEPCLNIEQYLYRRSSSKTVSRMIFEATQYGILFYSLKDQNPDFRRMGRIFRMSESSVESNLRELLNKLECQITNNQITGVWVEKLRNLHDTYTLEP